MAIVIDDRNLPADTGTLDIVRPVGRRTITHAIHDIDGTHSLIRDWQPVMSRSLHYGKTCGLREDFDAPEKVAELVALTGVEPLEETDRFCIESAGLSALTQMEWAIRRGIEEGAVTIPGLELTDEQRAVNADIIRRIWAGEEVFDHFDEPPALRRYIAERTPRLFKLYDKVLSSACRDRNVAAARTDPQAWMVPGSMKLLRFLHDRGVVNYFVTGAVIDPAGGGMFEEVAVLGYECGPGKLIEATHGSTWDAKKPKNEVMRELFTELNVSHANVLILGDGRSEIQAAVDGGSVALSRLEPDWTRQRELHREIGTNYIVPDYTNPALYRLLGGE